MADDKPLAVPLVEQLRSIPLDAVLRIDTPNALGCMDTRSIPVGRICHEAADALGVEPSQGLSLPSAVQIHAAIEAEAVHTPDPMEARKQ